MHKLVTTLLIIIGFSSCTSETSNLISFTVSPVIVDGENQLKIKLRCHAEADGETTLLFQDAVWGQDSMHNVIASMRLLNAEGQITKNKDSGWIQITHPKELEVLEFEYQILQDTPKELTTKTDSRPIIQPEYFHVFSHSLFMLPKETIATTNDNFDVHIQWAGFPDEYALQNSFGSNLNEQSIRGISEEKFHTALFAGGDLRIHDIDIQGNQVVFATRGEWEVFQDSTLVNILENTMTVQRNFWKDHSQPYFSVTMMPTVQKQGSSFHGTGLTNSFSLTASNNQFLEVEGLAYLVNHELQHNWIGTLIKNVNEEEQYWFSEGFTDYFTIKNMAVHEIYNLDKNFFVKEFNTFMRTLFTSPVKDAPNSEINYDNFWSSRDYSKLPYHRGALFAFYLDHKIGKDSKGEYNLDHVMLDIKKAAETSGQKLTHSYFIETVDAYLAESIKPFFDTHIEQGELMDLTEIYTKFGLEFEPTSQVFDLGFEFSEDNLSIASIDPNSEAYKAGLRQGDRLGRRSIYYGSLTNKAEFTVVRNGEEVPVSYYPITEAPIPQLKATDNNFKNLTF